MKFSITHKCWYVEDTNSNLELVLKRLNGVAEIDQSLLAEATFVPAPAQPLITPARRALREMEDKLILKGNSDLTRRTYLNQFELFLRFYKYSDPLELDDTDISNYQLYLAKEKSRSTQNQAINAIKYYYERVVNRERRTYYIERPLQERRLPSVFSEEEVLRLFTVTANLKHKLMLMLTYAGGLRRSETLNLRVGDIDVDRDVILVRGGKGRKDRQTTLGLLAVPFFREYIKEYKPANWLFEGARRSRYSESSFQKIFVKAMSAAGIRKQASLHTLRHSFATHNLEGGMSTRFIQTLLGHNSIKTTELYTHVTRASLDRIRSPLDRLKLPPLLGTGEEGAQ